jgi:hypothetical protein
LNSGKIRDYLSTQVQVIMFLEDSAVDDDHLLLEQPGVGRLEEGADSADVLQVVQTLDHVAKDQGVLERFKLDVSDPDLER